MTLLVIGGSSDIAMATIKSVAINYKRIVATYRTMNSNFSQLCDTYKNILPMEVDLNNSKAIEEFLKRMDKEGISPNHIVHCAASQCTNQHFHKMKLADIEDALQVGLLSLCQITAHYLKQMSIQRNGKILVVLSDTIKNVVPYCSQYIVSKYAMLGYVKSLAKEYGNKNIYVNGISPGWTNTKFIANQPDVIIEQKIESSKKKRLYSPEEVAKVIDLFLSDQSPNVNGENIYIDDYYGD